MKTLWLADLMLIFNVIMNENVSILALTVLNSPQNMNN